MRFDPSLFVNRLQVWRGDSIAYDEKFHLGINMIRSDGNSRGKSTITDLIFHALGGDLLDWKPEAGSCDCTLIEIQASGSIVTLRREIKSKSQQLPMWIFFGGIESTKETEVVWERYSYRRYEDRESFTQILFRHLKIEDTPTEDANITVNQILRLIYVDQITPINRIFRIDDRDSPLRRQAVGDLLCGIHDNRIYPSQMKLRQLDKDYAHASAQLASLLGVLRRVDEGVNFSDLLDATKQIESERQSINNEIGRLKMSRFEVDKQSSDQSSVTQKMVRDLDRVSLRISKINENISNLKFEIADAEILAAEIEKSLRHIDQAQASDRALSPLMFAFCPSCFTKIEQSSSKEICHLCKSKIDPSADRSRFARMRNELEVQLKESNTLQTGRRNRYRKERDEVQKLERIHYIIVTELGATRRTYTTETEAKIDNLIRRLGFLDRELIDLDREKRLGQEVARLVAEKESLNSEINALRASVQEWMRSRDARQGKAYGEISRYTAYMLKKDVQTDIGLVNADEVSI